MLDSKQIKDFLLKVNYTDYLSDMFAKMAEDLNSRVSEYSKLTGLDIDINVKLDA